MSAKRLALPVCLMVSVLSTTASAQSLLSFSIGGGPTVPAKHTGGRFDTGYNITAGLGIHPIRAAGVMAEFGYYSMGVNSSALSQIGVPGGRGRMYSVTLNPMVHLIPRGKFDVYLIGGGGFYRRTIEFTEPSSEIATGFDPFYGIFFPVEVPTTRILGSFSQNKGGLNAGAGVAIRLGADSRSTFFAESRYHYVYTTPVRTSILPVTLGFRW